MNPKLEQNERKVGKKAGRAEEDHKEETPSKKILKVEKIETLESPSLSLESLYQPIAPGSPSLDPNSPRWIPLQPTETLKEFASKSYSIPKSKKVIHETDSEESDDSIAELPEENNEKTEEEAFDTSLPKEYKSWFDALSNPINNMEPPTGRENVTWKDIEIHAQTNTKVFEMWIVHNEMFLRKNDPITLHEAGSIVGTYERLKKLYLECVGLIKGLDVRRKMTSRRVERLRNRMSGDKKSDSL